MAKPRGTPFQAGNAAGRKGRPRGSLNKTTLLFQQRLAEYALPLINTVMSKAMKGNSTAMKLATERLAPPLRENYLHLRLPRAGLTGYAAYADFILQAMLKGEISPEQATAAIEVITRCREIREAAEGDEKIARHFQQLAPTGEASARLDLVEVEDETSEGKDNENPE